MRSTMLTWIAAVLMCWGSLLSAQSTNQPVNEQNQQAQSDVQPVTEEITVVGIAESLREAVKVKHEATAIVDAIVAKDVNKLPDRNLAEAVQRVPGVVINREFGEGERVSLRGVSPNLVNTTVNGHNVAVADWFVLEQQIGRAHVWNSSHLVISYAVFCLKNKTKKFENGVAFDTHVTQMI